MHTKRRTVAVFDFDGTLTTKDSLIEFIRYAKGTRRLYIGLLLYAPILALMVLHLYDNSKAKEMFLSFFFKGMKHSEFRKLGKTFASTLESMLNEDTVEMLRKHRKEGADVYVITASVVDWVRPLCLALGAKEVLGTELETDSEGRLTGHFSTPNCYGGEKVRRLLMREPDRDSYTLYAYGDSDGDNEMLALADHPLRIAKH